MTRSFNRQKAANTEISFYSCKTWGAISTISSANANINKLRQATVYSLLYYLVLDCCAILALIYVKTRSKYNTKSSGLAPSPCLTPLKVLKSIQIPEDVYYYNTPRLSKYMFLIIRTRSDGTFSSSTIADHSLVLTTLS